MPTTTRPKAPLVAIAERFEAPCHELSSVLREAAQELLTAESGARSWGRRLAIDKDLAWRAYRMAQAADLAGVVRAMPGAEGLAMIERALADAGCATGLRVRFAGARRTVRELMKAQGIDRRTRAALVAGGGDTAADRDARRQARADARLAAARMWGIEARSSTRVFLLAPGKDGSIDAVYFNVIEGFRRLRPGPAWRVVSPAIRFSPRKPEEAGAAIDGRLHDARAGGGPLVTGGALAPLVSELTDRAALSSIQRCEADGGDLFFHGDGLPPTQRLRIAWGEFMPSVGHAVAAQPGEVASLRSAVQFPMARMTLRICFHRDIPRGSDPSAAFFITIDACGRPSSFERPIGLAPDAEVERVDPGRTPKGNAGLAAPYQRLLVLGCRSLGCKPADLADGFELTVANPPMLSNLALQWRLAGR
jgi:hypothetical protein